MLVASGLCQGILPVLRAREEFPDVALQVLTGRGSFDSTYPRTSPADMFRSG